ncbi:MAG: hypothetical protein WDN45_05410 [Caulobacteraceae bacterium]
MTGLPGDAGLQPRGHRLGRHAAHHLAVHDPIAGAEQGGEGADDVGRLFDEAQLAFEALQKVAPRARIDAAVLRIGVEFRLGLEQAAIVAAVGAQLGQQAGRGLWIDRLVEQVIAALGEVGQDRFGEGRPVGRGKGPGRRAFAKVHGRLSRRSGAAAWSAVVNPG